MSTMEIDTGGEAAPPTAALDMTFEVVVIPVSDVDRAKQFYRNLGWRLDVDRALDDGVRLVQFTPPGSGCSVQFGNQLTWTEPGSAQGLHLVVRDIEATHAELVRRGVRVSEVFHCETGFVCRFRDGDGVFRRVDGPAHDRLSYGSFAVFSDPDGNGWMLQEVTTRFPGRVDPVATSFRSAAELAAALRRVAVAHGEHEARTGGPDANWPDWYADYLVREQAGTELPA